MKAADVPKIITALMDKGWNQERIANELGVKQPTVSRWRKDQIPRGDLWFALRDLARREGLASLLSEEPKMSNTGTPRIQSIDAMLADQPDDVRATAADIVARLIKPAS